VLLIRELHGPLEVFMVQRHHQVDFASSALVFPGGKVDAADRDPALRALCAGQAGLDGEALAYRVAAIRETFEESGVVLAQRRAGPAGSGGASGPLLAAAEASAIEARFRAELNAGRVSMREIAEAEGLELACDRLVPFAHWITPAFMPKRFDTHFYLVDAPADQAAAHDGGESVDSMWIAPGRALAEAKAGRLGIIFPTRMQLTKLARSERVADAVARARAARVVTVLPTLGRGAAGPVIRIPAEADYGLTEAPLDDVR
jgi:8-oxo-dGTP pyrophosphatase MutT (NUDIX family)